jgi:hypothetical protein
VLYCFIFRPGSVWGLSSKTGGDASDGTVNSLMGKVQWMHRHLPKFLQVPKKHLRARTRPNGWMYNKQNGSEVLARKTTPDVWHSQRCSGIVFDEIARTAHCGRMVNGAKGTTNQTILITTPAGSFGWWPELIRGEGEKIQELDAGAVAAGVPPDSGYHHFSLHWRMDPRYDDVWAQKKQAEMSAVEWKINYEISYEASTPGLIWTAFSRHGHVLNQEEWRNFLEFLPQCTIYEGSDVGLHTSFVWVAHLEDENEDWDHIIVLDFISLYEQGVVGMVDAMGSLERDWCPDGIRTKNNPLGLLPDVRVGDPAMHHRNSQTLDTHLADFKRRGVVIGTPPTLKGKTQELRDRVQDGFYRDRIFFSPHCAVRANDLPSLVDAAEQYRLHLRVGQNAPEPWKGPESHPCDALQYACAAVWPTGPAPGLYRSVNGKWVRDAPGDSKW